MALTRIERNQIYEAIAASSLDAAECKLREIGSTVIIRHDRSGSIIRFLQAKGSRVQYRIEYRVPDGHNFNALRDLRLEAVTPLITQWANEVKEIADAPDLWAEMQVSHQLITDIEQTDSGNVPFTLDEQRQIVAQLQEAKKQLREQFELTSEQIAHVEERFDEAEQASTRLGRKDWLLLFGGTILNLIVTDTITPGVAGHIFTIVVQGLAHLFSAGPPQILG